MLNSIAVFYMPVDTSSGQFHIAADSDGICGVFFPVVPQEDVEIRLLKRFSKVEIRSCYLLDTAAAQIIEYLSGRRKIFELPFDMPGSEFEKKVYTELLKIHYGRTISYGEIAAHCGHHGAARAVGGACAKNPLPLLIPCHRVVGANGKLTGFGGGMEMKERLIKLECIM